MYKKWRSKVVINTESIIEEGIITFNDYSILIQKINEKNFLNSGRVPNNERLIYLTFDRSKDDNIENVFIESMEYLEDFLDKITLKGYSKTQIVQYISLAPERVDIGEEFKIVIPEVMANRTMNSVLLKNLKDDGFEPNDYKKQILRIFRNGLNSDSNEEKLMLYYTILERIAENESDFFKKYIINCTVCKESFENITKQKDVKVVIKELLENYSINSNVFKKISEYRNKIAHGGGKRSFSYYENINKYASILEKVSYSEVLKRFNEKTINNCNILIPGIPKSIHVCKKDEDGTFLLIQDKTTFKIPLVFSIIQENINTNKCIGGVSTNSDMTPKIDPISWPD